jgi:hypothetical protein
MTNEISSLFVSSLHILYYDTIFHHSDAPSSTLPNRARCRMPFFFEQTLIEFHNHSRNSACVRQSPALLYCAFSGPSLPSGIQNQESQEKKTRRERK